ncbi:MAG: 6-phosphogluconolactonase [Actinomycetes bacterium]
MTTPVVIVHRDADELAAAVAARLITRITDVQAARGSAHLVLTGGGIASRTHRSVADSPARGAVDWRALDVWWGDERFLPAGDPERNETQARDDLLDRVPVDPARVHPMPPSDGADGNDPEAAAERYALELAKAARPEDHASVPAFDLLMLGVGPDGHIASLFPGKPALYEQERTVVAVRGAPKPPPTRLSLTLPAIQSAQDAWLVVSGEDKAKVVAMALSGAGPTQIPAAGARGRQRTLWLLDRAAASALPPNLARPASP